MTEIFISYARSKEGEARRVADALRALGFRVWRDDELPAHRAYSEVIEERLNAAKAVVVIWSADAVKSEWVQSEADRARTDRKLVQLTVDGATLPMPFDRIQCADLAGWTGDADAPGWRKVVASVGDLVGVTREAPPAPPEPSLPLPSKPSIAVMPFANLSGDPEQAYFADGMVEEIVAVLSRFKSIFVIGNGSTLSFKGAAVSPQEAARRLGVRYVLEGSVRKAGGRVRIAVKLTDAADGAQIWADRFEDTLEDVFALQDKVALGVAGMIEPTVQIAEIRRAARRPTENMGGYDLYLRALPMFQTTVPAELLKALDLLDRAIDLDPDFGPALALAAMCHGFMVLFGWSDDAETHRRLGARLARRAATAGGDDAQVLAVAANALANSDGNLGTALGWIERAVLLNPGAMRVWYVRGYLQLLLGQPELAIQHFETAVRLDPLSTMRTACRMFIGISRFQQGRFLEAVGLIREMADTAPTPMAPAYLAAAYGQLGETASARDALARYRELSTQPIEQRARGGPEHRKLFVDGIAMAEGGVPADDRAALL